MKIGPSFIPETNRINNLIDTHVSFKPFVAYLEDHLKIEQTAKATLYRLVLDEFYKDPVHSGCIKMEEIEKHARLLELIYTILSPLTADENEYMWALSAPVSRYLFYGTNAFVRLVGDTNAMEPKSDAVGVKSGEVNKRIKKAIYKLVLNKFYQYNPAINTERVIYAHHDPLTGLSRYYVLRLDARFVEMKSKGHLPQLDFARPGLYLRNGELTTYLEKMLPLSNFTLEGFTVLTLEDITREYAIEIVKKALMTQPEDREVFYEEVRYGLKLLVGNKDVEFGILPFITLNGQLVLDEFECSRSILVNAARKKSVDMNAIYSVALKSVHNSEKRGYVLFDDEEMQYNPRIPSLADAGIRSFAALPVNHNKKTVGILEVYAEKEKINFEEIMIRLNEAIPLVAQLLQNSIEQFNLKIQTIIRDKFTSMQSSVQWRFNEVALSYYRALRAGTPNPILGTVGFQNVYPLYGMIDIKDSTIQRNNALKADTDSLVRLLHACETELNDLVDSSYSAEVKRSFNKWYRNIKSFLRITNPGLLNLMLNTEVKPYLQELAANQPAAASAALMLCKKIENDDDTIAGHRIRLEESIQAINSALKSLMQRESRIIDKIYPFYFATFRTDGIEYDIYTGQSISPEQKFTEKHLDAFRRWQIQSMCEAVRLTRELMTTIPHPLQTTQLIYVNPHPINISFRTDEQQFDIEGAYNIRYEIVKKRIDKVHVRQTGERLTQPGKIAIVYFNNSDAKQYIRFLKEFKRDGLLDDEPEMLDLEPLQGISGLKAIRVAVKF